MQVLEPCSWMMVYGGMDEASRTCSLAQGRARLFCLRPSSWYSIQLSEMVQETSHTEVSTLKYRDVDYIVFSDFDGGQLLCKTRGRGDALSSTCREGLTSLELARSLARSQGR